MNVQERVAFFKKQIKLEEDIVLAAEGSVANLANKMVQELILGIAMDSKKHGALLNSLVSAHEDSNPLIAEQVTDQLKKNLEDHIKLEKSAIDAYNNVVDQLEDEKEQLIIKFILNDEIRHHRLLKTIHKMIVEKETLTEQDLWDLTWKDAMFPQG